jgi:holo-ACP synthase
VSIYFKGNEQSLEDILRAREKRVQYQQYLLKKYRNAILSYKLNIPGPIKYNSLIKQIFDEGIYAFKKNFKEFSLVILQERIEYENSGPEYFAVFNFSSNLSVYLIKKLTTYIEETHPLGRLYDFDVIDATGKQFSREELGISPRKCLICDNNAFICGRSRAHSVSELIDRIETMAMDYFNDHGKHIK